MSDYTLISYAQNGEDVVLWRALGHVAQGRYIDVGACDPVDLSVTKVLYDRGWRGIDIDAVPEYADRLREARPGNEVVQAAITDQPVGAITFHQLVDTGLSTLLDGTAAAHEAAGFERRDITVPALTLDAVCERSSLSRSELHVLKIDVEGAEGAVLRSFDLARWRPWVVVVEATRPLSTEPSFAEWDPILVDAGYAFTLFDGISRFYASPEHLDLVDKLSYPACPLDDYVTVQKHLQDLKVDALTTEVVSVREDLNRSRSEMVRWRNEAVQYWANAVTKAQTSEDAAKHSQNEASRLRAQLVRARENLQEVRADRRRLRVRIKRMAARIDRMSKQDELPGRRHPIAGRVAPSRLRARLRRLKLR